MDAIKKENVQLFGLILLYKYLVDVTYIFTAERFAYMGLLHINESAYSVLLSWGLLLGSIPLILKAFREDSLSSKIVVTLYLISVVPTITLIGFRSDYSAEYVILICIYWIIFLGLRNFLPKIRVSSSNQSSHRFFYLIISACSLVVIYVSGRYAGFHLQTDLWNVYETREAARGFALSLPVSYLLLLADNILPFAVVYLIYRKQFLLATVLAMVVFLNFSITATKQIIALLFLGVLGYFFYRFISKAKYLLIMFSVVLVMSMVEPLITGTAFLNSMFPHRVFFIPAETHYAYFRFFSVNSYDFFTQGALSRFFTSDYDVAIAFLIGDFAIGDIHARANNGLFSDAYQNLGPIGVLLMPIFTVVYLKVLDGVSAGKNNRLFFVLILYVGFVLLGIPFTTALLSSGLFALLLVLYSLPRET